jgi:cytidine deaminase
MTADWENLRETARMAASKAYAPYSGAAVGAAVRTRAGTVFAAANIENASFGLAICAERAAILRAIYERPAGGELADLIEMIVAVDDKGDVLSPCGACRQVLLEFGARASMLLPNGVTGIDAALADPFRLPPTGRVVADSAVRTEIDSQASRLGKNLLRLLTLPEDDTVLLLQLLADLRQVAASQYANLQEPNTRALLFAEEANHNLVVAPGFYSNLEDPRERTICIPPRQGITGTAYSLNKPNWGVPNKPGRLSGDLLPVREQEKVNPDLKWVVAWPLREFGVVCLDGVDELSGQNMEDLARSPALGRTIERIDNLVWGDVK